MLYLPFTGTGTTLAQIRQRVAQEVGRYWSGTPSNTSTTTTLVDTAFPAASSVRGASYFKDWYLFRPGAAASSDKVRLVASYAASSASGVLTPDAPWTNAPTSAETYELHGVFEPLTVMNDIINQGLKRCFVVVEFSFTPVDQQTRHDISTSTATWMSDPSWVRMVGSLPQGQTDRNLYTPWPVRGEAITLGGVIYLNHFPTTFNTSDTVYVQAIKPAYYHARASGGTFGDGAGLSLETDQVSIPAEWAAWAALVEGWRKFTQLLERGSNQRLMGSLDEAVKIYEDYTENNFTLPELQFRRILRHSGPSRGGVGR